jgi:hypothetical protein
MTQFSPVTLSAEDVNNVELSAADVHKITLSVIDWFYVQILNAIIAQAAVKLGATALCSVLSKINAESAVVLGATGSLSSPARIIGSAGMALGATAEAEVSVTARIIALASVVLGAEAVMSTVSKIIGAAGVGLGATANVSAPSKIDGAAAVGLGASGSAAVRSLLVAQSGASFGAQVAAKCPAIIIGSAGMGLGATAELDAGDVVLWTPAQLGSSVCKLWLDANDTGTITKDGSNYVSQWNDKSGNGNNVTQGTGSLQPLYSSASSLAGNKPAIVYPNTDTGTKLNANVAFTLREIYYVCAYKDGLDNTFDYYDALLSGTQSYGKPRLCGDRDTANLRNDEFKFTSNVYINGNNTLTSKVLPMPLCIIRGVSGSSMSSTWTIGGNRLYDDKPGWKGIICEVIGFPSSLTTEEVKKVEGYLAHKWELTDKLPGDHPYKTNPPTV